MHVLIELESLLLDITAPSIPVPPLLPSSSVTASLPLLYHAILVSSVGANGALIHELPRSIAFARFSHFFYCYLLINILLLDQHAVRVAHLHSEGRGGQDTAPQEKGRREL